jgi:hypothetical protein
MKNAIIFLTGVIIGLLLAIRTAPDGGQSQNRRSRTIEEMAGEELKEWLDAKKGWDYNTKVEAWLDMTHKLVQPNMTELETERVLRTITYFPDKTDVVQEQRELRS